MHNAHVNDLHNPNKKLHKDREKEAPIIYMWCSLFIYFKFAENIRSSGRFLF